MEALAKEIGFFEKLREALEASDMGKWVVIHEVTLVGVFADFDAAAAEAVRRFGRGPYLIRQVGAPDAVLPVSIVYGPALDASP